MYVSSSQPGVNINTNTRSFAQKFGRAAPKLRIQRRKVNSNVEIGPSHSDLSHNKNCPVNIGKSSVRNTDIIFGPKDPDLQIELGEPNLFKVSNKGIPISCQLTRQQAGKTTGNTDWMCAKTADEDVKERLG